MLDVIEKLLALQERDQHLRAFQTELSRLPDERKAWEKQLADSAARLEKAKTRAKEIEVEKKTLQVEEQVKRDAITRYKQQQLQTRKNEEYSALGHEIEAAEKAISALEDKELVLMDEAEQLKPEIETAEKVHVAEKAKVEQMFTNLADKKTNLETRTTEVKADRVRFTEGVDEDVLERYGRLFQTKNGVAVAPLEHEVCMGCHMKVTTQTVVQVKSGKEVIHCPQCGRILYYAE